MFGSKPKLITNPPTQKLYMKTIIKLYIFNVLQKTNRFMTFSNTLDKLTHRSTPFKYLFRITDNLIRD